MKIVRRPAFLDSAEFKAWQERAIEARKAMVESKGPPKKFNAELWKEFKNDFLIPIGKCAYCEGRYAAGEFGDAEHYRPKGEVTVERKAVDHPGYFWLAYEWHNLLLSCKKCNSSHPDRETSTPKNKVSHPGKLCEFPISGCRIAMPSTDPEVWIDELLAEQPMLLNPYLDTPQEHIRAHVDGWISHKTERGRITIEVCHLNRKELRAERRNAETHVTGKVALIWSYHMAGVDWTNETFKDKDEFSTYLNCKLREELERRSQELLNILQKLPTI